MVDQEEEDLQMALRMSLQPAPPEPKRSKPLENAAPAPDESPEAKNRRLQRELRAAAAEKRMLAAKSNVAAAKAEKGVVMGPTVSGTRAEGAAAASSQEKGRDVSSGGKELSASDADQLFSMVFGDSVSRDILAQWSNQGIRFSSDPETSMGLVQHEGGPCGVLATLHAFVLKYLLFCPDELVKTTTNMPQNLSGKKPPQISRFTSGDFSSLTEDEKTRALVLSMVEILFSCGSRKTAVVATLNVLSQRPSGDCQNDETVAKALEGLSIESGSDLQKVLRVNLYDSPKVAFHRLKAMLPVFRSRMGAMLFLMSALLSRGLESVQSDRDDPSLPLVTAPFGHASQEIVNLLLCGQAVPNVFDGRMELGGSMFLRGIPTNVEVGFLTLMEFLNFCKVGRYLKCPKWPIWVIGSESHYTVLFALDPSMQDENDLEERESQIRKAFDAQDQSGGGGFISVEGLQQVLRETDINMPAEKLDHLCSSGFIVWSEFWQVLLELDKSLGGFKDSTGMMGKQQFDLYHFNGIAKSVPNGSQTTGGEIPLQRPRISKLKVSVPPKWTPEEFMANVSVPSSSSEPRGGDGDVEVNQPEPCQHAPLADCIRTRWPRAACSWVGDPPSIV